jgi:hypothetical protein
VLERSVGGRIRVFEDSRSKSFSMAHILSGCSVTNHDIPHTQSSTRCGSSKFRLAFLLLIVELLEVVIDSTSFSSPTSCYVLIQAT